MIPVQNIYYLLCYAWDRLDERDLVKVDATTCNNVVDLFAKVLLNGCTHLFKKGLDRGYVEIADSIRGVKGKIDFGNTLKQNLFSRGQAFCEYDELDYNILHNQVIKSTIAALIQVEDLDKGLKKQLRTIYHKFHGVDTIRINTQHFAKIVLHRNNAFYDFLLKVCRILHDNILVTEEQGKYLFKDFVRDEVKMRTVFEHFVRNFYDKHQHTFDVSSEYIVWNAFALDGGSTALLPLMKTDISLESAKRKIVIDTKYYTETLKLHYDKEKIRSGHLYQLFAYLKNLEARGGVNKNSEGILLYPTVTTELAESYQVDGHKISIHTINLNQDWELIHQDLLRIIK